MRRLRFVGWLLAYIAADDIIGLTPLLLGWNPGKWNWIGQIASILFALILARLYFENDEVGLRLPRTRTQIAWSCIGVIAALAIAFLPAVLAPVTRPDLETFAYEATLPGPAEELVFRGIGMALILRAFARDAQDRRGQILAVLVTAFWFTSGHVFHLEHAHFSMRWDRVLDVFPMACLYAIVRLQSRSLLGGVLAHNGANILVEAAAAIRT